MAFASLLRVVLASFIRASRNLPAGRAASVGPILAFACTPPGRAMRGRRGIVAGAILLSGG